MKEETINITKLTTYDRMGILLKNVNMEIHNVLFL